MKFIAALVAFAAAGAPPSVGLGHAFIPATREDFDNSKELWKSDWAKYRAAHPHTPHLQHQDAQKRHQLQGEENLHSQHLVSQ